MSTDVPHGDLEMEEAAWDADRVRYVDESIAAANRGYVLTAAEHVPTGNLVAFTQLQYPRDRDGFAAHRNPGCSRGLKPPVSSRLLAM